MTSTKDRPTSTVIAVGTTAAFSALGGLVVWLSTSELGHALTATVIGLVIGTAIFAVVAATSRRGS